MYTRLRSLLFRLEAERAHHLTLRLLHWLPSFCFAKTPAKPIEAMGLNFAHPVGLAAGLDKNGDHLDALAKLGFSFIELGTVTPKPQPGNPKPRLFRLPEAEAIINRLGFNNNGVDALINNVRKSHYQGILGINIGKNKDTPLQDAVNDYLHCLQNVFPYASYITVNVSSPNTPDLRQLQYGDYFSSLIATLTEQAERLSEQHKREVPLLVKVSPDETNETLKRMADIVLRYKVRGIIATNTTCNRDGVEGLLHADETGGLSGKPLFQHSLACLKLLKSEVGDALTLIGVGGIDSSQTAQEKLDCGASLVQIYTGLIYQGPRLIGDIVKALDSANVKE